MPRSSPKTRTTKRLLIQLVHLLLSLILGYDLVNGHQIIAREQPPANCLNQRHIGTNRHGSHIEVTAGVINIGASDLYNIHIIDFANVLNMGPGPSAHTARSALYLCREYGPNSPKQPRQKPE